MAFTEATGKKPVSDSNPYLEKFEGALSNRESVYAEIYEGLYSNRQVEIIRSPSKRRQKRIRLYQLIIGKGRGNILEIGCGSGDLTSELAQNAARVVGIDVSARMIEMAKTRMHRFPPQGSGGRVEFYCMGATNIQYENGAFDWVVSTSLIEHLHPDDIQPHLLEVCRVLKKGGRYLVWAPNRLGNHKDRDFHLSMFSYRELTGEMQRAGFHKFQTTFMNRPWLVNVKWKILLESWMAASRLKIFWSHLGIRNILFVAGK